MPFDHFNTKPMKAYGVSNEREKKEFLGFSKKERDAFQASLVMMPSACLEHPEEFHFVDGIKYVPQRLAYLLGKGKLLTNELVSSRCRNRQCCQPSHLFKL